MSIGSTVWEDGSASPQSPALNTRERGATNADEFAKKSVLLDKLKKTSIEKFAKDFLKKKLNVQQQSQEVTAFMTELTSYVSSHQLFISEDEKEMTKIMLDLERYFFGKIYKSVFGPAIDQAKDAFLAERISRLSWLTPSHLEIDPKSWNNELWNAAVYEIVQLDQQITPNEKLTVILNCCKVIIFLLSGLDNPAGADDLVPHLIYVLIRANPANLASNMEFIDRFSGPDAMRMEKYYYYTSLSVGVSFIESVDASQLSIDPADFERLMSETPPNSLKLSGKMAAPQARKAHRVSTFLRGPLFAQLSPSLKRAFLTVPKKQENNVVEADLDELLYI